MWTTGSTLRHVNDLSVCVQVTDLSLSNVPKVAELQTQLMHACTLEKQAMAKNVPNKQRGDATMGATRSGASVAIPLDAVDPAKLVRPAEEVRHVSESVSLDDYVGVTEASEYVYDDVPATPPVSIFNDPPTETVIVVDAPQTEGES